ncbi:MAG: hypothetical protein HY423_03370 [Candidatus Lambdaproteobacteria bacterium]|nr:hypothetical protein [Candidatus Lambdaproteobacteria bacterium]
MSAPSSRTIGLWLACRGLMLGAALVFAQGAAAQPAANRVTNSCVDCHSDAKFLVQNKKLYDYYQGWQLSVHRQEKVTCVDCHGGNPRLADKTGAHSGKAMRAAEPESPISYQNVPKTCANCHEDVYKSYQQSAHFKNLKAKAEDKQGPNCVTCHGSVNISVLNVGTVRTTCEQCHNTKTGVFPEIPEQAEDVLSNFLSIHRYYRFIATRGEPGQIQALFKIIDPRIKRLNASWHTFDLDKVTSETKELIDFLKVQRDQIARQRAR